MAQIWHEWKYCYTKMSSTKKVCLDYHLRWTFWRSMHLAQPLSVETCSDRPSYNYSWIGTWQTGHWTRCSSAVDAVEPSPLSRAQSLQSPVASLPRICARIAQSSHIWRARWHVGFGTDTGGTPGAPRALESQDPSYKGITTEQLQLHHQLGGICFKY